MMAGRTSFEADEASNGSTRSVAAAMAAVAAEPASNSTALTVAAPSYYCRWGICKIRRWEPEQFFRLYVLFYGVYQPVLH